MGKFYERCYEELSLHVRSLAWLHAAPQAKGGARSKPKQDAPPPPTRMQVHITNGRPLPLPPEGCAGHLVGYLFQAGPVGHGGMGTVPLQWQEITHWQHNTGIALQSWEATFLRRLSEEYLSASREAESPTCPAPWLPEEYASVDARKAVAKHIRSVLRD